jgi:hypothetical protein
VYAFLAVLLSVRAARLIISHRGNAEETQTSSHRRNTEETLKHSEGISGWAESPKVSGGRQRAQAESRKPRAESRRRVRPQAESRTLLPALAVWIGTPLLFYMYVAPPFAHACSAFAVALFVNVWLHVRQHWSARGAFALGLSAALMAMVREQDGFLALGPAIDFASSSRSAFVVTLFKPGLAGVIGFLLGYTPQLLAYNALNGYPGPAEHVSRKMYWYSPHALQVLASPHHGLFFWTPLAVLGIVGLFALRDRRVMACLLIMVASQVYVAGAVESWTVAGAFGQRRFVCLTAILMIGLGAVWNAAKPPRRGLMVIVALCVWWNVALMAQFGTRLMDRQRLDLARNAYHAFVTLPFSAPSLVYRYLTDRESFYESRPAGASR